MTTLLISERADTTAVVRQAVAGLPFTLVASGDTDDVRQAVSRCTPDVVIVDAQMPTARYLAVVRELHRLRPLPAIVLLLPDDRRPESGTSSRDVVARVRRQIAPHVARARRDKQAQVMAARAATRTSQQLDAWQKSGDTPPAAVTLLVIGTSLGGPTALAKVLSGLPADFPVPVLIVQHMSGEWPVALAAQLNKSSPLHVKTAVDGEPLRSGAALLAPGDCHLAVTGHLPVLRASLSDGPRENYVKPAVDVLFRTAAAACGPGVLAVVMTGMGSDGRQGAQAIHQVNGTVLVQDEPTSMCWGMPGAVATAGLADDIIPLDDLAGRIGAIVAERARSNPHLGGV